MTHEDPALERAKRRVKDLSDFYYHLMTYVLVNALLVFIDLRVDGGQEVLGLDWAYWVIFGWGFGIVGHAIYTFFGEHKAQELYEQEKERETVNR